MLLLVIKNVRKRKKTKCYKKNVRKCKKRNVSAQRKTVCAVFIYLFVFADSVTKTVGVCAPPLTSPWERQSSSRVTSWFCRLLFGELSNGCCFLASQKKSALIFTLRCSITSNCVDGPNPRPTKVHAPPALMCPACEKDGLVVLTPTNNVCISV